MGAKLDEDGRRQAESHRPSIERLRRRRRKRFRRTLGRGDFRPELEESPNLRRNAGGRQRRWRDRLQKCVVVQTQRRVGISVDLEPFTTNRPGKSHLEERQSGFKLPGSQLGLSVWNNISITHNLPQAEVRPFFAIYERQSGRSLSRLHQPQSLRIPCGATQSQIVLFRSLRQIPTTPTLGHTVA